MAQKSGKRWALLAAMVLMALAGAGRYTAQQPAASAAGRSATELPDGRWLLIGGARTEGFVAIVDPATGTTTLVPNRPLTPRAWHTATLLADGSILVVGGVDAAGRLVSVAERFDLGTETFQPASSAGLLARAEHSATLLSDGRVLFVGGAGVTGAVFDAADLWDPALGGGPAATLHTGRRRARAELLADGRVLIAGGTDGTGRPVTTSEVYDPATQAFAPAGATFDETRLPRPQVTGAQPSNGDTDVPVSIRVGLRFAPPLDVRSVNGDTVRLASSGARVEGVVVPAEQGRLAFFTPSEPLRPDTVYDVTVEGAVDGRGRPLVPVSLRFRTAAARDDTSSDPAGDDTWTPSSGDFRTNRPPSVWQSLPPLRAPNGVTALAGQALKLNGSPLAAVTLEIDGRKTETDRTGRFLLRLDSGPTAPDGRVELAIDGGTASRRSVTYGFFEARVKVNAGQTTALPFTIWMPRLDTAHAVRIPSPTTSEVVITTPYVPGLEVHLPPNTVIRGHDGQVVREVSLTPIPVDRPPFPLPEHFKVPIYFTVQPGGAYVYTSGYGGPKGARVVYPNSVNYPLDTVVEFYHYDPEEKGWYVYGTGSVSPDGRQVIPKPGVALYEFTGAMINGMGTPPNYGPASGGGPEDGDPVDVGTGLFVLKKTDLYLPDVIPLVLTRTYRPNDSQVRPFGIGATHPYAMFLWSANQYQEVDLILPDGGRVHYVRTSSGTGYTDAVFEHTATPTAFYKSVIRWNGSGWDLTLKDGLVYVFGDTRPIQSIRDRYGNSLLFTWSTVNGNGQGSGNLLKVTASSGRFFAFTYDGSNRVTQASDNIGRTVGYTYNANGELWKVTDPASGMTEYTYDGSHRMLTLKDARGITYLTNHYDANGRVDLQTQADTTTYAFAYTLDGSGKVTNANVTNPRGFVKRSTFNGSGYATSLVEAYGTGDARTTTYARAPGSNLVERVTDPLSRETAYTYDAKGNRLTVTRLDGTADAVTTTFTYESAFNQVTSLTDPLSHTTSFSYDSLGRLTTVTDPLSHQTTFTYNERGLPLTVTDALSHTTSFGYDLTDLTSITDPLSRTTTRFVDLAGRLLRTTNPLGQTTLYAYDGLNRTTSVTDARGGQTTFTYDANSNLLTLTDALSHTTTYTYDSMDRVDTRTDPLSRVESYTYDENGNLDEVTDRKGQVTTYAYDAFERLTLTTFDDSATMAYTYDNGNRLTDIDDSVSGVIARTWDDLNRLTEETTPEGTVSYTYDDADRRDTMTVAGQSAVSYSYDNANRLTGVTQSTASVGIEYDNASRRTSLTLPNGIVVTSSYDTANQISGLSYALGMTTLGDLTYSHDSAGNRVALGGSWARTGLPSAMSSATYDAANRIATWNGTSFAYDLNGNLTNDGNNTYTWNSRNQLSGLSGAVSASFAYDGIGRRRGKTVSGTATNFVYDGFRLVQELSGGTPSANLLHGLRIDEVFRRTDNAGARDLLTDAIGSTVALADGSGTVQTSYTYEPFGKASASGQSNTNAVQFTGRENDLTGLDYYRFRYYVHGLQSFASEDPVMFGGASSPYTYVWNSPVRWTDPLGLWPEDPECKDEPLKYKPGTPPASPPLADLLRCIQNCLGQPLTITSTSEPIPQHPPGTPHRNGVAADVRPIPGMQSQFFQCASNCGAGFGLDEGAHPSANSTAPHNHIQIPKGTRGGPGDLPPPNGPPPECRCK